MKMIQEMKEMRGLFLLGSHAAFNQGLEIYMEA